jgi:pyruvate,water dikinase
MSATIAGSVHPEPSTAYVVTLPEAGDVREVGAKASNLARMIGFGVTVPSGLVITRDAFRAFLAENELDEWIEQQRAALDIALPERIQRASRSISERVVESQLPTGLSETLETACRPLLRSGPLIVRSSGVGEDSECASFAGQLDSFGDIDSMADLELGLLSCWASYWSERSLFYQLSKSVRLDGMGVVIQQQVKSQSSGVLFTSAPFFDRDQMLLEFCAGAGEALSSGRITPGRVAISRKDLTYQRQGTPGAHDDDCSLTDATIAELAETGLRLETAFGQPQDIEWTVDAAQRLHLVQSRPITTGRSSKTVWSNANINENFPDPVSPFLYSIARTGYYHYFRNLAHAFGLSRRRIRKMERPLRDVVGTHCGRLYYNLSNIHAVLRMAPYGDELAAAFNDFTGADLMTSSPHDAVAWSDKDRNRVAAIVEAGRIAACTIWQYAFLSRRVVEFERTVTEFSERTAPDHLAQQDLTELVEQLQRFVDIRNNRWVGASLADTSAMVCHGLLKKLLRLAFPAADKAALHNTLLKGLPQLISAMPAAELWELSRQVRRRTDLSDLFTGADNREIWKRLSSQPEFGDFRQEMERFMVQWGFRFSGELMLTIPSYQENPAALIELLKSYVMMDGESPIDVMQRQGRDRERETGHVVAEFSRRKPLRFVPGRIQAWLVALVLSWTQRSIALRERARLKQALLYSRCRRIALAIGDHLVRAGHLRATEDIFWLSVDEIDSIAAGMAMFPYDIGTTIDLRRARGDKWREENPPDTFELALGEYLRLDEARHGQGSDNATLHATFELSGTGACGGNVTARAALVRDLTESQLLSPGDVLVTRQTDPGWGPLFFVAGGLVLERGGMLSHGAILAREYGIPCVVAVDRATERIASGQTVTVDGDLGLVRLVD